MNKKKRWFMEEVLAAVDDEFDQNATRQIEQVAPYTFVRIDYTADGFSAVGRGFSKQNRYIKGDEWNADEGVRLATERALADIWGWWKEAGEPDIFFGMMTAETTLLPGGLTVPWDVPPMPKFLLEALRTRSPNMTGWQIVNGKSGS